MNFHLSWRGVGGQEWGEKLNFVFDGGGERQSFMFHGDETVAFTASGVGLAAGTRVKDELSSFTEGGWGRGGGRRMKF